MRDDDPYRDLVIAIVARATADAQGHCPHTAVPDQVRAEARAWLRDPDKGAALLDLAGFESAHIVRQILAALAR